ncbi:ABC transporter substrate-binding protein [Pararobbsia silviterrae]|uniref:ABC transporter substrate-binding protein n=1 Tax=Pararobbsia silviterrae TaxID=1792498 RepID=A0A494XMC7_9BURK|nr:ABC transporter substrate-binding protein [Pararobbsia silviterrae]RKP48693.1 ABC transporter substrate-binding protein [Pararobbsia silviterrae]
MPDQHARRIPHDLEALRDAAFDEYRSGRVDRRTVLRYASVIGLSGFGALLGAGPARQAFAATPAKPTPLIRVAGLTPAGAIDPLTISDPASVPLLNQTCDYLVVDDESGRLIPSLATSWAPNAKGDVWTFALRDGVRFHDGQILGARDVVATFDRLTDPASGSAALSAFKGVLSKGGTRARDARTVEFHLDAPNGNFPYYVSSDTYNAVILPASYTGGFEKTFIGTGPFRLEQYAPQRGATFVRNPTYWGAPAIPERVQFAFYADAPGQLLAMQGRQADVMPNLTVLGGLSMLNNPAYRVLSVKSSSHRQIHMRCDTGPFADARVREALALTLDRDAMTRGLFRGHAQPGNDSPFAPVFASTDTRVAQRRLDLARARELMNQAGLSKGFAVTLTTERFEEIGDLAVLVQNAVKPIGIAITLKVEPQGAYYGSGTFGKSDWLDSTLGITDYGHRGIPNVFLSATLTSGGPWNAAHYRSTEYDRLVSDYVGALDLPAQRTSAAQIQQRLLTDTPVSIPYFFDALTATTANLSGVRFSAISQLYLERASLA